MANTQPQLITRRRHYFYVLVFSVAAWLFIALAIGAFYPIYFKGGLCLCSEFIYYQSHYLHYNISFFVFGLGGIVAAFLTSPVINRMIIVANAQPQDEEIPLSRFARYGKLLLTWRGACIFIIMVSTYVAGHIITHKFIRLHPDKIRCRILHVMAKAGNNDRVKELVSYGYDINARDANSYTPMHYAAAFGKDSTISLLLELNADIDSNDHDSCTPLHAALDGWQEKTAVLLIMKGADINAKDRFGITPLHTACIRGYKDVVILLLQKGVEINAKRADGRTVLDCIKGFDPDLHNILRAHGAKTAAELEAEKAGSGK
ncbi:MAG: ankyrin repeat domain-containing protein [Planctomycetota bacterium]|jgi:hypothetical protein